MGVDGAIKGKKYQDKRAARLGRDGSGVRMSVCCASRRPEVNAEAVAAGTCHLNTAEAEAGAALGLLASSRTKWRNPRFNERPGRRLERQLSC